jgi:hypothetical protein
MLSERTRVFRVTRLHCKTYGCPDNWTKVSVTLLSSHHLQTLRQIFSPPFCPHCSTESPRQQHSLLSETDICHLDRVSRIDQLSPNYPCGDNKPPVKASLSHPFAICKMVSLQNNLKVTFGHSSNQVGYDRDVKY